MDNERTQKIEIYYEEQFNLRLSTEIWVHGGISLYQRSLYQKQWGIINIWHSMDNF